MNVSGEYTGKHRAGRGLIPYLPALVLVFSLCLVLSGLTVALVHAHTTQATLSAGSDATSETPLKNEPVYGSGLPVLERCSEPTSATANFRGNGFAGCDFVTLVGNDLAGIAPAEYQYLSIVNPTTGEAIEINCQGTQDSALNDLWLCTTHYGSQIYIYP